MSPTMSVEEAQANVADLIQRLIPGDEIVITRNQQPVAKLVSERPPEHKPRVPGNCKGMIVLAAEDDEHLKDFAEYAVMRFLLDTHAFLWFITNDPQLSAVARSLIVDPNNEL